MIAKLILIAVLSASAYAGQIERGCAVESRAWQILHEAGCWSRLVRIEYGNNKTGDGHAVCVFSMANNDLWVYDCNTGSRNLGIKSRDIVEITTALGLYYNNIRIAKFMDDQ